MIEQSDGTMYHSAVFLGSDIEDTAHFDSNGWLTIESHTIRDGVPHRDNVQLSPEAQRILLNTLTYRPDPDPDLHPNLRYTVKR